MTFSRYARCPVLNFGNQLGTSRAIEFIRSAIKDGTLDQGQQVILRGLERLDTLAGVQYGDGRYWWILAAASNIGWGLQVPPGTIINYPVLSDIVKLIG